MLKVPEKMNMENQSNKITVRNLTIFTVIVLASGWVGRGVDVLMGNPPAESLGMLLWLVTPLLVSLLLRAFAGDGWRDFGIKPNFKGNVTWYIVALLVFPVVTALVLLIGGGLGLITFPNFSMQTLGLILQTFALGLLPQFIKNIFEEAAWRGYLAPKIHSLRLNDYVGHIIVGLVWGTWHIPYYLFFLDKAILPNFTTLNLTAFTLLCIAAMIAWATVFGEIRLLTNSIWAVVLMHMVEDAFLNQLFTGYHIQILPGADWLVSPMNGLVSIFLFVALGIVLRQLRRRRQAG